MWPLPTLLHFRPPHRSPDTPAPLDLHAYLDLLRQEGELVEVEAAVDPVLEAPEIHRRVIAAGGPALLFHNPQGAAFPLVTNLFGTARRIDLAFGPEPERVVAQAADLPEELMPPSLSGLWRSRGLLGKLIRVGTRTIRRAPVTEVRDAPTALSSLPALKTWERDGGRFLTLPLVQTRHPDTGVPNLGIYRIQMFEDGECGMHIQIHRGGGFHYSIAEERGESLPANILLGGPPALILGALAPLPENVSELLLTSLSLGKRLEMTPNPAGPLPLAARAEFALVGEIPPHVRRPEGPFGDHYGYYSERHDYPVFRCKALLRRRNPIFPATVVGKPRQEDFFIGDYLQRLLSPLFPRVMPSVRSLWSYGETGYHSLTAAVVHDRYRREAMVSAFRILGEGQLSLTKFLLITDQDVDLKDFRATLRCVLERTRLETDLFIFSNVAMDTLDYAGPRINEGSKGVLLGLGDPIRSLPESFEGPLPPGATEAAVFCPGCLVVQGTSHDADADLPRRLAGEAALAPWPLVVLSDDAAATARSPMNFLWRTFTRFDPASDLASAHTEVIANQATFRAPLVLDARMKASYPEELFCDEETADRVDRRWNEYFTEEVPMGDSGRAHLD
jgi:UbiD family decarboxylase